eukprot:UN07475
MPLDEKGKNEQGEDVKYCPELFQDRLKGADRMAQDLIKKCLIINPKQRFSAVT